MSDDDQKRDDVLRRMLKTPPKPHKKPGRAQPELDAPMPDNDDPKGLVDWAKRNIQKDD